MHMLLWWLKLFQIEIWALVPKDLKYYELYFYNKGQIYLTNPKIFGSEMIRIYLPVDTPLRNGEFHVYKQDFRLTQTHWKAIDNKEQRCDDRYTSADNIVNTSACIVAFLEQESNCSMATIGSKNSKIR